MLFKRSETTVLGVLQKIDIMIRVLTVIKKLRQHCRHYPGISRHWWLTNEVIHCWKRRSIVLNNDDLNRVSWLFTCRMCIVYSFPLQQLHIITLLSVIQRRSCCRKLKSCFFCMWRFSARRLNSKLLMPKLRLRLRCRSTTWHSHKPTRVMRTRLK